MTSPIATTQISPATLYSPKDDKEAAWEAFRLWREEYEPIIHDRLGVSLPASRRLRTKLAGEVNWRCCYCGIRMFDQSEGRPNDLRRVTIEHIWRRADNGGNDWDNLTVACAWCNSRRGQFDALVWFNIVQLMIQQGVHPHYRGNHENSRHHPGPASIEALAWQGVAPAPYGQDSP